MNDKWMKGRIAGLRKNGRVLDTDELSDYEIMYRYEDKDFFTRHISRPSIGEDVCIRCYPDIYPPGKQYQVIESEKMFYIAANSVAAFEEAARALGFRPTPKTFGRFPLNVVHVYGSVHLAGRDWCPGDLIFARDSHKLPAEFWEEWLVQLSRWVHKKKMAIRSLG